MHLDSRSLKIYHMNLYEPTFLNNPSCVANITSECSLIIFSSKGSKSVYISEHSALFVCLCCLHISCAQAHLMVSIFVRVHIIF